jgi:hypothetical protein
MVAIRSRRELNPDMRTLYPACRWLEMLLIVLAVSTDSLEQSGRPCLGKHNEQAPAAYPCICGLWPEEGSG